MPIPRLTREHTAVLVVDVQEKLMPLIHNAAEVEAGVCRLLDGAAVLKLGVSATEQYRKGIGDTIPAVVKRLSGVTRHEKLKFSAFVEPVREDLAGRRVRAVLVCGIEAHVCVMQTCLDLMDAGYLPFLVTDAVGSRRKSDHEAAVARLTQAGAVPTTVESALLEMTHEAGTPMFKAVLGVIK